MPLIFVNANLIDFDLTALSASSRFLKDTLLNYLVPAYHLRSHAWGGIVVRQWPRPFGVYSLDPEAEGGYRLISTSPALPSHEELNDLAQLRVEQGWRAELVQAKKSKFLEVEA
jgi:hypothetical protein